MLRTILVFQMLLTHSFVASANEVYYCSETGNSGFNQDKQTKAYSETSFNADRFKMNLDGYAITLALDGIGLVKFSCKLDNFLTCTDGGGYMFNFNSKTHKFIFARGYGNLTSALIGDSISIAYGTCEVF